ncbi:Lipoteichoic acid synthase [bacterium HR19]|nr:Lipoteichoic acid synthase [bacterium HR19]
MTPTQKSLIYIGISLLSFQVSRLTLFFLYFKGKNVSFLPFVDGIRFDFFVISTFWSVPLAIVNLPIWKPKRTNLYKSVFLICSAFMYVSLIIMLALNASDIVFFGYSGKHISTEILSISEDLGFITHLITKQYLMHFGIFLLFSALLLVIWIKIARADVKFPDIHKQLINFILLSGTILIGMRGTLSRKPIHIVDAFTKGRDWGNLSLNGAFTIYRTLYSNLKNLRKIRALNLMQEKEAVEILGLKNQDYPFKKTNLCKDKKREKQNLNIIVFILESWNPEFIDSLSGREEKMGLTPNFDKIAGQGIVFERAYSAGTRSIFGIQAILTGVPVLPLLPPMGFGLDNIKFSGIGEILKRKGYKTIFIQSSHRRSYRLDSIAKSSGFDHVFGMEDIHEKIGVLLDYPDPKAPPFGWDYETLMFLKKQIDRFGEPFSAFVFTGTTHPDFPPLPKRFLKYPHSPKGLGGYLNTLFYSDWSIGEFMNSAESSSWFQRTIFIFTADHPAYVRENRFDKMFHIPFVIFAPRIFQPKRIKNIVVPHYDIIPTILDILCVESEYSSIGKSVFSKSEEDFAFVSDGEIIGIISPKGYLVHDTKHRISAEKFQGSEPSTEDNTFFDTLEKKLLALTQLEFTAIQKNRWAE